MKIRYRSSEIDRNNVVLASKINEYYKNSSPQIGDDEKILVVGVLNGAFIFLADLVRRLTFPLEIDFVRVSSYGNEYRSSGTVRFLKDVETTLTGRRVLIVEDIVETGRSLAFLRRHFLDQGAAEVKIAVFLNKNVERDVEIPIDFAALETSDSGFLVGYGLDAQNARRELPDIWEIE